MISVIVPVYKVEPYLDRCVRSIVEQTYTDLEIILVDDGSPDNCPAMCDAWAKKDSRIKVIHKQNGGLSDARNAGMDFASGEYIGFVDSDDWIAAEMYQTLYDILQRDNSDIAACGVQMVWEDGRPPKMLTYPVQKVLDSTAAMLAIIEERELKQPVWYKLYRRNLISSIRFPVGKYHEDVFWSYQAMGAAQRVSITDTPYYFYTQRTNSIMGETFSLHRLDTLEACAQRQQYIEQQFPPLAEQAAVDFCFRCIYQQQSALRYLKNCEQKKASVIIKYYWNQVMRENFYCYSVPLKQKIWLQLAKINFIGICRLRNLLQIGI